ncbi:bifunctional 3'-5' exonuclease/DNA polymerase [Microbacterium gorillae]|uniref:bifunctional 3'-5' exonuclease/DNA polymerase n=1 Tax=Microbacterium gorillae TaxID=1231063 RepID=UPI000A8000F2|nr:bifunctional 3'-5' exonuclease/DNA polymerase [Microbacterium gorillae]
MTATWAVVGADPDSDAIVVALWDDAEIESVRLARADFPGWVAARAAAHRWVWGDTTAWYPDLLAAGVRIERCQDLRLCHAILRDTMFVDATALRAAHHWDIAADVDGGARVPTLFDVDVPTGTVPREIGETVAEFVRQRDVLERTDARLRLLTAAESAGALVAAEMRHAGLPWNVAEHERILTAELGTRTAGGMPSKMIETAARVRQALGDPAVSLDSQPKLLRALHRAGVLVESTSKWELARQTHPAIEPLLAYKRMSRLLSANGWTWLDEWVHDGRFRPVYIPGGVVTGRWASAGGGALQLPRQLRAAVRADPGWQLVTADVAQLEPRVLAGMARDTAMATAARGRDLYASLVEQKIVETRQEAKYAMLGALYGSTSGESGRLVPRLRRAFPRAMGVVDAAAKTGEDGGLVATLLGRTCPPASAEWTRVQRAATDADVSPGEERLARSRARERGRFTRNFVVQGTAAEWALAWLADLRLRLARLGSDDAPPHLAFFLHDEVIVHAPAEAAEAAAQAIRDSADAAGKLLFGDFPIDFPLDVTIGTDAVKA